MYSKITCNKDKHWNEIYIRIYNDKDTLLSTTVAYPTEEGTYKCFFIVNSQLTLNCLKYLIEEKIAKLSLTINLNMCVIHSWDPNNIYNYFNMYLTPKAILNVL
jgi:hypothetical protein